MYSEYCSLSLFEVLCVMVRGKYTEKRGTPRKMVDSRAGVMRATFSKKV